MIEFIHVPQSMHQNKDSPLFFKNLDTLLELRSENKIIIGDFNLVLDENLDRSLSANNNKKAASVVKDIMSHYKLADIWRERNPNTIEYSWFRGTQDINGFRASRIDFILISKGIDQMANTVNVFTRY